MKNTLQVTETETVSMTSLEIAELTGKRHDHVVRDIRTMLAELYGEDRLPSFGETVLRPNPSGGAAIPSNIFNLPKRETLILVSGYSTLVRAKIIDRITELETQIRLPAVTADHSELLVEINARLEGIERTQTPTLAKKSVQNWNGHYARDLARVQGEIRTLKLRIKQIEPKPDGEQAERSYLKRLIQHQLILEEIIHRNNQYQQLWSQYQTLLEQVENP